ncbi:MAG: hypothetical protein WCD81_10275 [Candidatus Bathyarchaeia archaeon]
MAEKNEKTKTSEDVKVVSDSVSFSESADVILVRSPLRFLGDIIAQKRFLEGVVVSVMYFERFGTSKLQEYFKSKGIRLEPMKLQNMHLSKIMAMLEGFDLIDHRTHSLMGEVCKERNEIVHELSHPDAINEDKAKETIEKAIECLKALGAN